MPDDPKLIELREQERKAREQHERLRNAAADPSIVEAARTIAQEKTAVREAWERERGR